MILLCSHADQKSPWQLVYFSMSWLKMKLNLMKLKLLFPNVIAVQEKSSSVQNTDQAEDTDICVLKTLRHSLKQQKKDQWNKVQSHSRKAIKWSISSETKCESYLSGLLLKLLDCSLVDAPTLIDEVAGGGWLAWVDMSYYYNVYVEFLLPHGSSAWKRRRYQPPRTSRKWNYKTDPWRTISPSHTHLHQH